MANLLRTEWYKLWHSWYFWGIGIFTFLLSSILLLDSKGKTSNLVMASLYNTPLLYFLIIVFIALFIGNDLGGRTLNAYLTAGHKRGYVFWAKVMVSQIGCILILTVPLLTHEIIGRFGMKERFPEISGTFTVAFQILFVVITMCALPVVLAFVFRDMGKTLAVSMVLFFLMIFLMNGQHAESLIRILPMGQLRLIALQKFDRTTGVIPQLVAAQLHTGHVHDAQKLGGVGHKAAVQLGDGLRKAVQLPDAGVRKLGEGLFAVGCQHLAVELLGGAGQTAGHQQAAHSPQQQGEEHRRGDDLLHGAGKAEQDAAAHRAHQQPLFVGEGRVAAVQVQALDRRIAGLVVQRQPAFAVRLPAGDLFHARVDDVGIQSVARHQRQEQFRVRQARRCGHQQIGTLPAVLQLLIRHLGFQIAGQDLHTDDAVHGAVRQDEGLGVGNGRALVTGELVGLGEPAAVVGGVQLFVILPGGLEHGARKAAAGQAAVAQCSAPAFVGGDAQLLDHCRTGTLDHQVGFALRGAGVRVQVPQVHAGHGAAHFLFRKVVGVDHKKDAGHGAGAQCTHQIGRGGLHQGVSGLAALVHRVQRNGAVLQHLLGQVVDGGGNVGELLCLDQHILQVAGAVAHLHVHDLLGVLVQPPGHIGQADAG